MHHSIVASEFPLRASPGLRCFSAAVHVGLAMLLMLALWSRWPLVLLAVVLLLSGLAFRLDRHFALRAAGVVRALRHDTDGWSVATLAGEWQPIQLTAGTTVTHRVIVLAWAAGPLRSQHLLVTPGMLPQGEFRRLCRLLWQATPAVTSGAQSV